MWIESPNPFNLMRPTREWVRALTDYDKMLRVFPSQTDRLYRLTRVVRREARLGLDAMVVHKHPDTVTCIQHGVVPVAALVPWAVEQNQFPKILRDLRDRDAWKNPHILKRLEEQEAREQAAQEAEAAGDLDERSASAYRAIRYGRPTQIDLGKRSPESRDLAGLWEGADDVLDELLADHPLLQVPSGDSSAPSETTPALDSSGDSPKSSQAQHSGAAAGE